VLSRITVGRRPLHCRGLRPAERAPRVRSNLPFYFGGTALLIVVGVALDTVNQIESYLITRNYEGITGATGARIRGRRSPTMGV
jgi:preprotein translocase subunit SecY